MFARYPTSELLFYGQGQARVRQWGAEGFVRWGLTIIA